MSEKKDDGKVEKQVKRERRFPIKLFEGLGPKEAGHIKRHRTRRPDGKPWFGVQEQSSSEDSPYRGASSTVKYSPLSRFYVDHFIEDENHILPHLLGEDCIGTELLEATQAAGKNCGVAVAVVKDKPRKKVTVARHIVRYTYKDENGRRCNRTTLPEKVIMRVLVDKKQAESLRELYRLAPELEAVVKLTLHLLEKRNRALDAAPKAIDGIVALMNDSLQRHPNISDIVKAHGKIIGMAAKQMEGAEVIDNAVLILDEYTKWLCADTIGYAQAYGPYGKHMALTLGRNGRRATWVITGLRWTYSFYDKSLMHVVAGEKIDHRKGHVTHLRSKKILYAPGQKGMVIGHIKAPKRVTRTFTRADPDLTRNDARYLETQRHMDEYLEIAVPFSDALLAYVHAKDDAVQVIDHADGTLSREPVNLRWDPDAKAAKKIPVDANAKAEAKAKLAERAKQLRKEKREKTRKETRKDDLAERAKRDGPDSKAARLLRFMAKHEGRGRAAITKEKQ